MSRFVIPAGSPEVPAPGRSAYEDRPAPEPPWIQVAETNLSPVVWTGGPIGGAGWGGCHSTSSYVGGALR
jgi:hypothetical protein